MYQLVYKDTGCPLHNEVFNSLEAAKENLKNNPDCEINKLIVIY